MSLFTDLRDVLTPYANKIKDIKADLNDVNESFGDLSDLDTEDKTDLVSAINEVSQKGLSNEAKDLLLACFRNVAWTNENGQDLYSSLARALYGGSYIRASFNQGNDIFFTDDSLEELKDNLTVTYHDDPQTTVLSPTQYTLLGSLAEGSNTITVTYLTYTTTFNVNVMTNIASSFANMTHPTASAAGTYTINNNVLSVRCTSQSAVDSWWTWLADTKGTHWDDVTGKTLYYRIKVKRTGTSDEDAFINWYAGMFSQSEITSMNNNTRRFAIFNNHLVPTTEYVKHTGAIVANISNFPNGSVTPDENTMVGHLIFVRSLDTIDFAEIKMGVA